MEKTVPMDRLICGDVGYGKTEIAVRAAFKAVQDGKQVAVSRPDDPPRAAALRHVLRAVRPVPGQREALSRFRRTPGRRRRSKGCATAPSTSSSARTACLLRDQVQGPGPGHRRRGAAVRRRAQGAAEEAAGQRRRPHDVRDPIPRTLEMAVTGIREMSTITTPPRGAPPGPHLRRTVRGEADRRGHPPRTAPRGPGLLHPQPRRVDRPGGGPAARHRARGAHRDRPRPDVGTGPGTGRRGLLGEEVRRPRLHDDRRVRHRHLERQHAHRRARRQPRLSPSSTSCAAVSAVAGNAATRTSSTRPRSP